MRAIGVLLVVLGLASTVNEAGAAPPTSTEARAALRKAVDFFRTRVSTRGGYLWRYSEDLSAGEGEGAAEHGKVWVQAPGTPFVGLAYLDAHELLGEAYLLDAAVATASALVEGQLNSSGWDYWIEFDPARRRNCAYRVDGANTGKNVTTLDDDTTQLALRFLMRVDQRLAFQNARVHDACMFGLDALMKAQYPNGAWPQRYSTFPDPSKYPIKKASFPPTWSRAYVEHDYRGYYTFNDNTIANTIETLFLAAEIYGESRYRQSAEKAGQFILLAQMPEPQPGWAQQYDFEMHPAWARKFEPPAMTGRESQQVMRTLLDLYRRTGDKKYLEPIPRALDYYEKSLLPDNRLARFYELQTNLPLYFTGKYELTYASDDLPTHYGFIVSSQLNEIRAEYQQLASGAIPTKHDGSRDDANHKLRPTRSDLAARARPAVDSLDSLDDRGAWVEPGRLRFQDRAVGKAERVIESKTFVKNLGDLSAYIATSH